MIKWQKMLVSPDTPMLTAVRLIDESSREIALIVMVVDAERRLLGTVTDGDIRRAIIAGLGLEAPVAMIMNRTPSAAQMGDSNEQILNVMQLRMIRHLPRVDHEGRVVGIEVLEELFQRGKRDNWVVLMAGGAGTRLRPLTDDYPKPLLKIGNKPILETILENFIAQGFHRFFLSVNYKAEMLANYFQDGKKWGVSIRYLREGDQLGTAGSLSLLPEEPHNPLIVMNGDLLTKVNFAHLLDFHAEQGAKATMCVREYDFSIPYGVVRLKNNRLLGVDEKPVQRFWVNAGVYVLEPSILKYIPTGKSLDMPDLFQSLISRRCKTTAFPIHEYWLDIGRLEDFERAKNDYWAEFV